MYMNANTHSIKLQTTKPLLILLYWFPGSGKTYFARQLSENIQAAHIHGDRIRNELFEAHRYDRQENAIIKKLLDARTDAFLTAGRSVLDNINQ